MREQNAEKERRKRAEEEQERRKRGSQGRRLGKASERVSFAERDRREARRTQEERHVRPAQEKRGRESLIDDQANKGRIKKLRPGENRRDGKRMENQRRRAENEKAIYRRQETSHDFSFRRK